MKTADGSAAGLRGRLSKPVLRTQPDDRLVELVREGSDLSFEVIVERYHDALLRYCRRFLDPARCEDVVQQTFTNALIFMRESDRELALRAWLYRVVHNSALKVIAGKTNREAELSTEIPGAATTGAIVESRDEFRRVINEIGSLSDSERQALLMRTFEGDSYETIALALESTPNGARQLIHRVRTKLRAAAAMLLPLPLLRWFAQVGNAQAATVAGGAGTAGVAVKIAAAVAVGVVATGAGVVATQRGGGKNDGNAGAAMADAGTSATAAPTSSRTVATNDTPSNTKSSKHGAAASPGSGGPAPTRRSNDDGANGGGSPTSGGSDSGPTPSSGSAPQGGSTSGGSGKHTSGSGTKDPDKKTSGGTTGGSGSSGGGGTSDNGTTGSPSTTNVSGGKLIVAGSTNTNQLTISRSGSRILIADSAGPGVKPTAGSVCVAVDARQTSCPASGFATVRIDAGYGDDTVVVESSVNFGVDIDGGYGRDTLIADGGINTIMINGGPDNDVLRGSPESDSLDGSTGADVIDGRGGNDGISGSAGDDRLCGSDGTDYVNGGTGNDQVYGGSGANNLRGDAGSDTVFSPAGNVTTGFEQTVPGTPLSC